MNFKEEQGKSKIASPILKSLVNSVKIISWFGLVLGSVGLICSIGLGWSKKEISIMAVIVAFSTGLRIVSEGLSKKKRWAWYLALGIFGGGFIYSFYANPLFKFFIGFISGFIFLGLLYFRKDYFKKTRSEKVENLNYKSSKIMVSLKSEIRGLIRIITILGWLSIIVGVMGLFAVIATPGIEITFKSLSRSIIALSGGILYVAIAEGLTRKKMWAWYLGIIAFIYSAISNFVVGSIINIGVGVIALVFLILLLIGKKSIFE